MSRTKNELRREQIFTVGASLFAERGYDRTSLQEVADRLGITKPAIYYYYRSKEDLLYAITDWVMDRVLSDITEIRNGSPPALEKLRELIRRYIGFFALHPAELTLMSTEVDSLGVVLREKIIARQREYMDHLRAIVSEILAENPGLHLHETSVVFALLGGMNWIFKWYDPAGAISPEALAQDFMKVFTNGLTGGATAAPVAPKGG